MSAPPAEAVELHTRLLKCALEAEDARAYWQNRATAPVPTAEEAFERYWFGARSLDRVRVLLGNFRSRFEAFPDALDTLTRWPHMDPATRAVICHWHVQLSDPLYRAFTGTWLVERRHGTRPEVTRDLVLAWVSAQAPDRWTMGTRIQFASKLLSTAHAAGLVATTRDPRPLGLPRVTDDALAYALHLLREVEFAGTLVENPYLRSVGLEGPALDSRLRGLVALSFQRQGGLLDFGWRYPTLHAWADAELDGRAGGHP